MKSKFKIGLVANPPGTVAGAIPLSEEAAALKGSTSMPAR
jgi:hypothetical protein